MFDGSRPVNSRVLNVTIRCIECDVPRYEPLELDKYYKVVSQSFIGDGGDGFTVSNLTIIIFHSHLILDSSLHRMICDDMILCDNINPQSRNIFVFKTLCGMGYRNT